MILEGINIYDGSILKERFAYKVLKKDVSRTGDIFAFVAPMEVVANLIDIEDKLNNDFIYSDKAINFIIEIPDIELFGGVCFQRLFNAQLGSLLCARYLEVDGYVDGDDIMVKDGEAHKKASVSIAGYTNGAVLIHTGINIDAGPKAPTFAYSTNLSDEKAKSFMIDGVNIFRNMTRDIFVATTKTII
jgi:hypothetical protein